MEFGILEEIIDVVQIILFPMDHLLAAIRKVNITIMCDQISLSQSAINDQELHHSLDSSLRQLCYQLGTETIYICWQILLTVCVSISLCLIIFV